MADQTSTIPKGWKMTTLGEVADVQTGPFGSQLHKEDYVQAGTPIITVENLVNDLIDFTSSTPKVSDEDKKRLGKYTLQKGDIVFSRVGSVDRCAFVSEKQNGWLFSGRLLRVRSKEILFDKYAFYWIAQESIKDFVRKIAVGATMPSINTDLLSQVPISFPALPEQRAIAAVLSSLDDKIELLREQNKTLEANAQAIFKEWFVNFNFPGATGKMIASELGEIPEGWRVGRFGEKLKIEYGKSDKEFDANGIYPVYGAGGVIGYSNSADYRDYQVIVGCRGTCGNITLAYEDSKITHNSLVISNSWFKPFIYLFLQNVDIEKAITGSTQPQITIGDLSNIEITIPPTKIIDSFSEIIAPIFQKLKNNNLQIQTLSVLRDALLPKLMRGEVRVKGFSD